MTKLTHHLSMTVLVMAALQLSPTALPLKWLEQDLIYRKNWATCSGVWSSGSQLVSKEKSATNTDFYQDRPWNLCSLITRTQPIFPSLHLQPTLSSPTLGRYNQLGWCWWRQESTYKITQDLYGNLQVNTGFCPLWSWQLSVWLGKLIHVKSWAFLLFTFWFPICLKSGIFFEGGRNASPHEGQHLHRIPHSTMICPTSITHICCFCMWSFNSFHVCTFMMTGNELSNHTTHAFRVSRGLKP